MNKSAAFIEDYTSGCMDNEISFIGNKRNEEATKDSYEIFKDKLFVLNFISFKIIYVFYGFVQFFATWNALVKVFHHDNIIMMLASLVLGFLPFIGTGFGIYGAHTTWGWSLLQTILIFLVIPYFIVNGPLLMVGFFDMYKDWLRWQSEESI